MPKVSVIIPTYNRVGYLREAVDSVLRQTYRDFEIIVVDDGSIDGTRKTMERYARDNLGVIRYVFQENKGHSAACNHGMRKAMGEYISFLDNDDFYQPDRLGVYLKYFGEHPDVAFIMGRMGIVDEKGRPIEGRLKPKRRPGHDLATLIERGGCSTSSFMVRSSAIEGVTWDESAWGPDDLDFTLQIVARDRILVLDDSRTLYREHSENSQSNKRASFLYQIYYWRKWARIYGKKVNQKVCRKRAAELQYLLASEYFGQRRFKAALMNISKSLCCDLLVGRSFIGDKDSIRMKCFALSKPYALMLAACLPFSHKIIEKLRVHSISRMERI